MSADAHTPSLNLVICLTFLLKLPNDDWDLPEFPHLYLDLHEKNIDINLDSANHCLSRRLTDDIFAEVLQRFGDKIAEAISAMVCTLPLDTRLPVDNFHSGQYSILFHRRHPMSFCATTVQFRVRADGKMHEARLQALRPPSPANHSTIGSFDTENPLLEFGVMNKSPKFIAKFPQETSSFPRQRRAPWSQPQEAILVDQWAHFVEFKFVIRTGVNPKNYSGYNAEQHEFHQQRAVSSLSFLKDYFITHPSGALLLTVSHLQISSFPLACYVLEKPSAALLNVNELPRTSLLSVI
ncbi:hypothetical protein J3A83DRAFT_4188278 [Scleroderma citrinum]